MMRRFVLILACIILHHTTSLKFPLPTPISIQAERTWLQKIAYASLASLIVIATSSTPAPAATDGISSIPVQFDGIAQSIGDSLGKKGTLIVNVASQCALTPQYEDLVALYKTYQKDGLTILAFPCNQFGSQEPENDIKRIRKNMLDQFGVTFPIFDKIEVNGPGQSSLYTKLKSYEGIGTSNVAKISWNFEKFLIDKDGIPVRRYKPGIEPPQVEGDIKELLKTGSLTPKKKVTLNDF